MFTMNYWYYWAIKNVMMAGEGITAQYNDEYKRNKHLSRIARRYGTTPKELCKGLLSTGDTLGTISYVIREGARCGVFTLGENKEEG